MLIRRCIIKFHYKNNWYKILSDQSFVIRSSEGNCGYSWFKVTDENIIEILENYLEKLLEEENE